MISFRCTCSHLIEVPEDQAGNAIQCTGCGRLVDVPLLSDLASIADDGSYLISDEPQTPANNFSEFNRTYQPGRVDADGKPIDLRGPVKSTRTAATPDPEPRELAGKAPIYDPETGRRIDPLDLSKSAGPLPHEIPMARLNLGYSSSDLHAYRSGFSLFRILLELLHPANIVVMSFLALGHLLVNAGSLFFLPLQRFFPMARWIIVSPLIVIILGHYGNVIEDVALEEKDGLPRPLRNLSPYEDIINPAFRMTLAFLTCFWPAFIFSMIPDTSVPQWKMYDSILMLGGQLLLPAALIAACTSDDLLSLLPHRLLKVIYHCGFPYLASALLSILIINLAMWMHFVFGHLLIPDEWIDLGLQWHAGKGAIYLIELVLLVYLLHAFTFHLGMLFRRKRDFFDWTRRH